ncbi:metallophosphoesterase [Lactococcus termiticola]|uniref:Phosphohydrolase n=1 Tax=Lactococcus termiticola TaxID=2169526 RepID=A0A2R5HE40_9LACT|nr:metallophosphoesterase [Lactococcus termiticola]GBG96344.1 phosphohydrolase [Lactococcus termiticola]
MTKLGILSDFHMDSNHFNEADLQVFRQTLKALDIDQLHFAGDISNDWQGISKPFMQSLEPDFKVTANLGNHDMLGLTEAEIEAEDYKVYNINGTAFLSFHGWYDYAFMEEAQPKKIQSFKQAFYFDRKIKRELSDPETTDRIIERLKTILSDIQTDRIIIATHFVPHKAFIINTRYEKLAKFNAFLGSPRFHKLFRQDARISDVVFGHIHHRMAARLLDGIRYYNRPLGYPYEWQLLQDFIHEHPELEISQPWKLRKQYQKVKALPEWQAFRQKNLSQEFKSAITIFEL